MPLYFFSDSAAYVPGMASMWLLKLGLQKYLWVPLAGQTRACALTRKRPRGRMQRNTHAIEYRGGCSSVFLGGSTTLWMVLLMVSLLHLARRSPALTTHVFSMGVASTN